MFTEDLEASMYLLNNCNLKMRLMQ